MAFWGIELKPGKPFRLRFDDLEASRLHVSQATLGLEPSGKRTLVKCKPVDGPEIIICSLLPGVSETCALDLFFCNDCDFTVVGSSFVHLSGYYFTDGEPELSDSEDSMDESEDYDALSDIDSDEDEYDYSDDDDDDMRPRRRVSSVKIEELNDEEPPNSDNAATNGKKKKASQNGLFEKSKKQQDTVKPSNDLRLFEVNKLGEKCSDVKEHKDSKASIENKDEQKKERRAEDVQQPKEQRQDGVLKKKKRQKDPEKASKLKEEEKLGEKVSGVEENKDNKAVGERNDEQNEVSEDEDGFPINLERKSETIDGGQPKNMQALELSDAPEPESNTTPLSTEGKKKRKRNKKKDNKTPNQDELKCAIEQSPNVIKPIDNEVKTPGAKTPAKARTYPNGLVVEAVQMGKPDGKQATPGKKIEVIYTGKLKSTGHIFDSNIGKKPFRFILGIGEVVKGWDVGVNGMRVGDKRRLTIPPAMGYGPKGVPGIPPNSWLVFDVELVDVK